MFWEESLQGYWNEYQIKHYGKTRVDYNNTESDIDEDEDEPEENWKIKAEESDRVMGTLSAGLGQEGFNRDFKVVYAIGYCDLDGK